jgi:putative transposase
MDLVPPEENPTRETAHQAIFEYIEGLYNSLRIHSSLGYSFPDEFELRPPAWA